MGKKTTITNHLEKLVADSSRTTRRFADGIDLVGSTARPMTMEHAITNGFGFGGVNASALFRRWN